MPLRNGDRGYGLVTKALHWLTVLAFAAQFVVGYTMEAGRDLREAACDAPAEGRSGGARTDAADERLDRIEERCEAQQDRRESAAEDDLGILDGNLDLVEVHVVLGLVVLGLGVLRVTWRRATPLPPWDPRLTPRDQRIVHVTEVTLLTMMFVVPTTGIALVLGDDDDLLPLHVAAHVAFFAALAAHLAMVLGKRLLPRML